MEVKEITAKERELGIPWRIASMNEKNCFYVIHGKDYTETYGREIQILSMQYGYHPIKEHRDRIRANAEIIVEAVNNYTTLHSELEKARELLRECQDRLETILVIGVERDEVNMLIKKLNILQNPSA